MRMYALHTTIEPVQEPAEDIDETTYSAVVDSPEESCHARRFMFGGMYIDLQRRVRFCHHSKVLAAPRLTFAISLLQHA